MRKLYLLALALLVALGARMHYAETLHEWHGRFLGELSAVRRRGFDERFFRMWDHYLAYCEGAFRERYISNVQLVLSKVSNSKRLIHEPDMELEH